jgi:ribosomal protein L14
MIQVESNLDVADNSGAKRVPASRCWAAAAALCECG